MVGRRRFWLGLLLVVQLLVVAVGWCPQALAFSSDQKLILEAWRIVDRAYVDDRFNGQNWWRVRQQVLKQPIGDRQAAYDAIDGMLEKLEDPFTRLLTPDRYRTLQVSTSGELTGVGLQIAEDEDGVLKVLAPIAGTPAEAAGIQPGDRVLEIDGVATASLSLDDAAMRMRGEIGTRVVLKLERSLDGTVENIELVRDRIAINPVFAEARSPEGGLKIGYIRLSQFNGNAAAEMASAIENLEAEETQAYILDLRNNPGGLLQAGIEISRLWLDEGTIVYTVNRQSILESFESTHTALTTDPMVVLVNEGTASASEILAGALKDNDRAVIVGRQTFGKGSIQSLFDLSDDSGLAVTVAKYQTPDRIDINKRGIAPDIAIDPVPLSRDRLATKDDPAYQTAVQLLSEKTAIASK